MYFQPRGGWHVQFLEVDLKDSPAPALHFPARGQAAGAGQAGRSPGHPGAEAGS
jgi:hypothetical protein